MEGISIAENPSSFVVLLDKKVFPRERIADALKWLRQTEELDLSHLGEIDPNEQAELEAMLNSISLADREIGFIHEVTL